jgi:hypothetical protein
VKKAIEKGVEKVWSLRRDDGSWEPYEFFGRYLYSAGPTALAAYALLESGVSPQDERMAKTLAWLSTHNDPLTYTVALRCQVWLIANRQTRNKYQKEFEADVKWLMRTAHDGRYSYDGNFIGNRGEKDYFDNSNGQFGVLGVWAGARANMEFIDSRYWQAVLKHWMDSQRADGGWGYNATRADTIASMTAAGVATMFVCMDNLLTDAFASCDAAPRPEFKTVNRGVEWLTANFKENMNGPDPYYLYALERVGLASGFKYFGDADWYKTGAQYLVRTQSGTGSWTGRHGELEGTVFSLLFLVRGSNPVMFNKLEYTGDWDNRPRAVANLTEWVSRNFEGSVNWQIINLKVPATEWHDAPILYISGAKAPTFTDDELAKLRAYVQQGGTIFSVSECAGKGFNQGMREAYAKLFPEYELKAVDKDHDLYSVQFHLVNGTPPFFVLSNGIRPLAIHVERDMVLPWQMRMSKTESWAFQAAANVYLYVTDKDFLRRRGATHWPEEPAAAPARKVKVARLKYPGNWDPEPLAYQRFGRMLATQEKLGLDVSAVEIKDLAGSGAAVATLTGTTALQLNAEEKESLKKFVTGGGLLVVDAGGGSQAFAESARGAIQEMFGEGEPRRLETDSPLFAARAIKDFRYRRQTKARLGGEKESQLRGVMVGEAAGGAAGPRLGVLFSREDLTGGLVGYASYACDGYAPQTAYEIMRNVMLLAAAGPAPAPASAAATAPAN